jgi:hypothetical protein
MKHYVGNVIHVYQHLQQEQNRQNQYNEYTKRHSDMKNKQIHILQDLKIIFSTKLFLSEQKMIDLPSKYV